MELTKFLAVMAAVLPVAYGAPVEAANQLHPEILAAMKRDLGLDAEQATARVARELAATDVIENARRSTGDDFAGAWVARDGAAIHVAITNEARAAEVEAAGATPVFVRNSLTKLEQAKLALDGIDIDQVQTLDSTAEAVGVAAYFVDVASNKLVIEALPGSVAHAEGLAAQVGLADGEFEVVTVQEMPTTLALIRGGDPYYINRSARCSVGFAVTTGFVSAGHCGTSGSSATTSAGAALGTFSGSVFPGSADMSYIRAASGSTYTNAIAGASARITGSTVTAVGGSICRSGSTTGVFCGSVRALGATVNYAEGRVTGLTQTNVCAEPGDSGGSFYSGAQAQGVTSGGSGNCNSGGTTYFQPVNEILSTYGLTLVRS
ncbi:trypsin [Microdochium trichocladiopsis]|uniref:Trypsin n=1 Tax=Microdochium trichocladiopsis TaxID=1682393 RepID=A0A9P8XU17_9PEZI|nr:trypsin [Microdochium trichocladiopsis]KAH7014329.1 trypsin [Microdochium trichocladiopsis]